MTKLNKKIFSYLVLFFMVFYFILETQGANAEAGVVVKNFKVDKVAGSTSSLSFIFSLTGSSAQIRTSCGTLTNTGNVWWVINHNLVGAYNIFSNDAKGVIPATDFSGETLEKNGNFSISGDHPESENFYLEVWCESRIKNPGNVRFGRFGPTRIGDVVAPAQPGQGVSSSLNLADPWANLCGESACDIFGIINKATTFMIEIAIPIAVGLIIFAGIMLLTSAGDPGRIGKAKDMLRYTVIGFAVLLIGKGFFLLIQSILNLGQ